MALIAIVITQAAIAGYFKNTFCRHLGLAYMVSDAYLIVAVVVRKTAFA